MTVYSVNLGIGWASSGVEYAQKYRNESFEKLHIPAKFIFSDLILGNNIEDLTKNMGYDDDIRRVAKNEKSNVVTVLIVL